MVVWLSYYCRPAVRLKQKTHRQLRQWVYQILVNESKPDCRAGQQRVCKQQVQIQNMIHDAKANAVRFYCQCF
jgi:hypothetical protein